jgi:hypothetical protein
LSSFYLTISGVTDEITSSNLFLSSAIDTLSSFYVNLSTYTDSVSAVTDHLISLNVVLSSNIDTLSASLEICSSITDSISASRIIFGDHTIGSDGTIIISPSSRLIVSTISAGDSGSVANIWSFDEAGITTIPGRVESEGTICLAPTGQLVISTISADGVGVSDWIFAKDGELTLPGVIKSEKTVYVAPSGDFIVSTISADGGGLITSKWIFDKEGELTIPGLIKSENTITVAPSGDMIISTTNADGSKTFNWIFDKEGALSIPGAVKYATNPEDGGPYAQPIDLDISLSVQKLNSGTYNLPDGDEGQIMHFVPKSLATGDTSTQIYIANARYWIIDPSGYGGRKIAVTSPFYWMPWVLSNHRLDPVYDIFPSIAVAIFTDGAWNISTGGRNWYW